MSQLLRHELRKKFGTDNNKKILSKNSGRLFNKVLIIWILSAVLLTFQANESGWDSSNCDFCNQVAEVVPSIDKVTKVSEFPAAMRIQWLYLTVTSPFVLIILLIFIRDVRKGDMRPIAFWVSVVLLVFALYIAWTGALLGLGNNYYAVLYRETLYGAIIFSSATWLCVVSFTFYILVFITSSFKD